MLDRFMQTVILAQANLPGAGAGAAPAAGAVEVAAGSGAAESNPLQPLIFIGIMLVVFYFMLIRPQQTRAKKHKALIEGLKRGDDVITTGGMYGKIRSIEGNTVTLEIAKNTHVRVLKQYVGGLTSPETEKELAQTAQGAS